MRGPSLPPRATLEVNGWKGLAFCEPDGEVFYKRTRHFLCLGLSFRSTCRALVPRTRIYPVSGNTAHKHTPAEEGGRARVRGLQGSCKETAQANRSRCAARNILRASLSRVSVALKYPNRILSPWLVTAVSNVVAANADRCSRSEEECGGSSQS